MKSHDIVDTYCAHIAAGTQWEEEGLRRFDAQHPHIPEKFLTLPEVGPILRATRRTVAVIMSLGRWFENERYLLEDDAGNEDPQILFHELNEAILRASPEEIPPETLPFVIVAGKEPDAMLPHLEKHAARFRGMKIPAFTALPAHDDRYVPVYDFAKEREWPVLIHCSENPENPHSFDAVLEVAKHYPNLRVTASHLGGDNPEITQRKVIPTLREKRMPDNLWLNTAVHNVDSIPDLLCAGAAERIVFATDIPFFHAKDHIRAIRGAFGQHTESVLRENGLRSLGR